MISALQKAIEELFARKDIDTYNLNRLAVV